MNKLAKNIFYGLTFGLSVILTIAIYLVKKKDVASPIGYGLILMYILFGLAILVALVLAVKGMIDKPKAALMTGVGVGVLILLVIIGYFVDDHTLRHNYAEYGVTTEKYSGIIGGSLIATWVIMGLTILLTVYAAITDIIKKL